MPSLRKRWVLTLNLQSGQVPAPGCPGWAEPQGGQLTVEQGAGAA